MLAVTIRVDMRDGDGVNGHHTWCICIFQIVGVHIARDMPNVELIQLFA